VTHTELLLIIAPIVLVVAAIGLSHRRPNVGQPQLSPVSGGRWLGILLAVALVVRVGALLVQPYPDTVVGLIEPSGEVARNIVVHNEWLVVNVNAPTLPPGPLVDPASADYVHSDSHPNFVPLSNEMPGEALILAGLWFILRNFRYIDVQILQILADLVVAYVVYLVAVELFNKRRTALIALSIYALALPVAFRLTLPIYDVWAGFFGPVVLYLILRSRRSNRPWRWYFAVALATGIGVWFRAYLVLIPVAASLALVSTTHWRRPLAIATASVIGAVVLLSPLTVRNAVVYQRFIPANIGFGQVLWEGLGQSLGQPANDFGAHYDDGVTYQQVHAVAPSLRYGTPEYDAFLFHWALSAISQHPVYVGRQMALRLLYETILLHDSPPNLQMVSPRILRLGLTEWMLMDWPLVTLALLGFALTVRQYPRQHLLLGAVLVAGLLVPTTLQFEYRYIAPVYFVYVLWAALAVDWIAARRLRASPS
jgi:4-amino-4-deoxy-L-arabinose transferase-like glycosyltransferase